MSYFNKLVWIDDELKRKDLAESIDAVFVDVRTSEGDIEQKLEALLNGGEPKLVIIDHYLNDTSARVFRHGSTIAEAVKGNWPTCPVIGVTAAEIVNINERSRLAYDDLFDSTSFGNWQSQIQTIGDGFDQVQNIKSEESKFLLKLLDTPLSNIEQLFDAFPEVLKNLPLDPSYPSAFYGWIKHLINRPGFLYDYLWAATFLGLNESGFSKFEGFFDEAKYAGIFFQESNPRWWSDLLGELLYRHVEPISGKFTWHAVRELSGVTPEDFSRCYKCNEEYPETVAFLDSNSLDRAPMHLDCTALDPRYKRELYFEDMRMLVEGEE